MKVDYVSAARENATGSASTILYTAGTTHACNTVPVELESEYVELQAIGGNIWYFFTMSSTAEVDRAAAASAAGNSGATVGRYLASGNRTQEVVPDHGGAGNRVYICRESDVTNAVLEIGRK